MTEYGLLGRSGWVPGIALPHPPSHTLPRVHHLPPPGSVPGTALLVHGVQYGRGAQIGSSTLFIGPFLAVKDYDRGL